MTHFQSAVVKIPLCCYICCQCPRCTCSPTCDPGHLCFLATSHAIYSYISWYFATPLLYTVATINYTIITSCYLATPHMYYTAYTSCYLATSRVILLHLIWYFMLSCYLMLSCHTSYYLATLNFILLHLMFSYNISCYLTIYHVILLHLMLSCYYTLHGILQHLKLSYYTSCYLAPLPVVSWAGTAALHLKILVII